MNASRLSQFEFCGRLPSLSLLYEPIQLHVHDAAVRYFERGVRYRYGGVQNPAETIREEFIHEAIDRGFTYPDGDPYVITHDHASWLEGVIHLLPSIIGEPIPVIPIEDDFIEVDGILSNGVPHIFRVVRGFNEEVLWAENVLSLIYPEIVVHTFKLPAVSRSSTETVVGRLHSPACMSYVHPLMGTIRLAHIGSEKKFGKNWKRMARWEDQTITWEEWRLGIERDQCLGEIYRSHRAVVDAHPGDIRADIAHIIAAIDKPQPRLRERCRQCEFCELCHGGEDGRHAYRAADEVLRRMRTAEADLDVPPQPAAKGRQDNAVYVLPQ